VGGAVALGVVGSFEVSAYLAVFVVVGIVIALAYNLELAGGRLHNDLTFVLGWVVFRFSPVSSPNTEPST